MSHVIGIHPSNLTIGGSTRRAMLRGLLATVPLIIALPLLGQGFSDRWVDETGYNGAWVSTCARNYVRYGLMQTGLLQVRNEGWADPERFRYYIHHPPGVPLLVASSFILFGESEAAARVIPIGFTLLSVVVLFGIARRGANRRVAMLACVLFVLMPMTALFGRMVNHEAVTLFWMLLLIDRYLEWRTTPRRLTMATMAGAFCAGALCGWPMFYLGGLIPLHSLLADLRRTKSGSTPSHPGNFLPEPTGGSSVKQRRGVVGSRQLTRDLGSCDADEPAGPCDPLDSSIHARWYTRLRRDLRGRLAIIVLPVIAIAIAASIAGSIYLRTGFEGFGVLGEAFLARSGGTGYEDTAYTNQFVRAGGQPLTHGMTDISHVSSTRFVARHMHRAVVLFTPISLMLACLTGVACVRRRWRNILPTHLRVAIGLSGAAGILHILLFRQGAWAHDYWMYYLTAPIALAAASGMDWMWRGRSTPGRGSRMVVALLATHAGLGLYIIQKHHRNAAGGAEFSYRLGESLRSPLQGSPLATNLAFSGPFTGHYAQADVVWNVGNDEALERATAEHGVVFYLMDPDLEGATDLVKRRLDMLSPSDQTGTPIHVAGRTLQLSRIAH